MNKIESLEIQLPEFDPHLSTHFPKEYEEKIRETFFENFQNQLHEVQFFFSGKIEKFRIHMTLGYLEKGRLKQNNFHLRFEYNVEKQNVKDMIHYGLDLIATIVGDFIQSEETMDLPRNWKSLRHGLGSQHNFRYELMYSTENTELESIADAILQAPPGGH